MYVTATINHVFISFSAVQIYDISYSLAFSPIYRYITNSQSDQLPVGLIAQLAEHCTGIAEVMSSNLIQAELFQALYMIAMVIRVFIGIQLMYLDKF